MARRWFKRVWTRFVPKPVERSTFVLFASLALIALFAGWRQIGGAVWEITNPELAAAMQIAGALGWCLALVSTFLIDHFGLFGLRQVYLHARGRAYEEPRFLTPSLYRLVRHPLYLGFLIAFWVTPVMTASRLFFAALMTAYIFIAIRFEERDLLLLHGSAYGRYRDSVPMILPLEIGRARKAEAEGQAARVS
jgi:protein-S-isoprenylcysteine O-methyltransferase Ste14